MNSSAEEVRHFAYIDAARGFAFLAVLAVHTGSDFEDLPGLWLMKHGSYGVQLFFLVSAITLCYSAAARLPREAHPWLCFYIRRFFRIAPLFWLAMIFYWTMPGPIADAQRREFFINLLNPGGAYPHPWQFITTALFVSGWSPYNFDSVVPGGWSISIEMTFYAVFPLLFIYLNSLRRSLLAVLACLILSPLLTHIEDTLYHHLYANLDDSSMYNFCRGRWFPCSLLVFLVGICAYHVLRSPVTTILRKDRFAAMYLFLFSILLLAELFRLQDYRIFLTGHGESMAIIFTMAAAVVAMSSPLLPWVVNPAIRYIGKISFSCYLTHFFMIKASLYLLHLNLLGDVGHTLGGPGHQAVWFLILFCLSLILTIMASTVTYHAIEKPGIACGRWLIRTTGLAKNKLPDGGLASAS